MNYRLLIINSWGRIAALFFDEHTALNKKAEECASDPHTDIMIAQVRDAGASSDELSLIGWTTYLTYKSN